MDTVRTAIEALESATKIAQQLQDFDPIAENAPDLVERLRRISRHDTEPPTKDQERKDLELVLKRIMYGHREDAPFLTGHRIGIRRYLTNELLKAHPWKFCRMMLIVLATAASPTPEMKDLQNMLERVVSQRQVDTQTRSTEMLSTLTKINPEQREKFLAEIAHSVSRIKEHLIKQNHALEDLPVRSALRFMYSNMFCAYGNKITDEGFDTDLEFWSRLRTALGLRQDEGIDPGAFVDELEREEWLRAGSQKAFRESKYYKQYEAAMMDLMHLAEFDHLRELVRDPGGLNAIETIINSQATREEITEAAQTLKQLDISVIGHVHPEAIGWEDPEHALGDKVRLEEIA